MLGSLIFSRPTVEPSRSQPLKAATVTSYQPFVSLLTPAVFSGFDVKPLRHFFIDIAKFLSSCSMVDFGALTLWLSCLREAVAVTLVRHVFKDENLFSLALD